VTGDQIWGEGYGVVRGVPFPGGAGYAEGLHDCQENFRRVTPENDAFWCIFRTNLGFHLGRG